jgi:type IX secretion system PorP/SprF family membrane protein
MRTLLILFACAFPFTLSYSQQDAQFTQYMYNMANINPAYAGSRGLMSIFGLYRTQWVGVDGAPTTSTFSINTPLENSRLGLGLSIINDRIGPTKENAISADLSYTVPTSEIFKLSFGVKATANFFNLDPNKLNPEVSGDENFQDFNNKVKSNFGVGLYLHSNKAYIGLSVPMVLQNERYNNDDLAIYKEKITYYLSGGYVFDLSSDLKFKPAFLTKIVQGAPLQFDLSGNFLFYDKFGLGGSYRWSSGFSALAGFQLTDGLYIGYGYDTETTSLGNYNSGSHEIFLRFELFKKRNKVITPRFF